MKDKRKIEKKNGELARLFVEAEGLVGASVDAGAAVDALVGLGYDALVPLLGHHFLGAGFDAFSGTLALGLVKLHRHILPTSTLLGERIDWQVIYFLRSLSRPARAPCYR